jgi:hypothetical protein
MECGAPTPLAPALGRSRRATALGAAAVAALVIAIVVLAIALATRGGDSPPATTVVGTEPFPTLPPDTTLSTGIPPFATTTLPPDTSILTLPTVPVTTDPAPTVPVGGSSDWPSGRTAWTAVVSSIRSLSEATATKGRVQASGQPAGVLESSDFSTLRPGYYVVFSGVFDTQAEAAAQSRRLEGSFPGSYPRRIAP